MSNRGQSGDLPPRGDGSKSWADQHLRAAQLKARGRDWPHIAKELDYALGTVQNYASLDGFDELVAHYRDALWHQEIDDYFRAGSLDALGALRDQWQAGRQEVAEIERRLDEEDLEPKARAALERRLYSRSKAVTLAADKFLGNMGFAAYRKRVAELEAEEQVQGHFGQTTRVEGGDKPVEVKGEPGATALEVAGILAGLGIAGPADRSDDAEDE